MARLTTLITSALALALGAAAAPSVSNTLDARCTTTILAPYDTVVFDLAQPDVAGWSTNPFFEIALNIDGSGYKQLVRFAPPSTGTCSWVLSLPQARYERDVLQIRPYNGPVLLTSWAVQPGGYAPGFKLADVQLKPGPFGVNAIQPGVQTIHAEPCAQIGGEFFAELPPWSSDPEFVYWMNDIKPANASDSLGIYMLVQQC
ncbi:hypothetical protein B0T24DRAFT_616965 [Lasiosphaeria ovina]|uniref:Ubiquitin 3 binding protein But2 C-terminal domain-containing protein n=1 Tax=Lasiosphaeria ovina TaxID=92902 RepID=A0AAE0KH67_9PEZI|nr:hypothetical protein B0T24DRAFT_616965 [Lasiosphaeria ovina]